MIKAEWTNKDSLDLQQTCNQLATDLISRQDALMEARPEYLNPQQQKLASYNQGWNDAVDDYYDRLKSLPSADRPTGHIVTKCSGKFNPTVWAECSECGKPIDAWDKFCRHCGAKMGGDVNEL